MKSLPGAWAENLTAWEAQAEPVRLGDHVGAGNREHASSERGGLERRAGASPKARAALEEEERQ